MASTLPYKIPPALRKNQKVVPFVARLKELQEIDPIISFFCKMHVLMYVFGEKLDEDDEEVLQYCFDVFDHSDPKQVKSPSAKCIMASTQLTLLYVFDFATASYKSYIESTQPPGRCTSAEIARKLHASIVDWSLMALLKDLVCGHGGANYRSVTHGLCDTEEELIVYCEAKVEELKRKLAALP